MTTTASCPGCGEWFEFCDCRRPTINRFDQILKDIYLPRVAAMLDGEDRGLGYWMRFYALPPVPAGVITVHLDDEAITQVGHVRRHEAGWWQAWADDVPAAPIARAEHWDEAVDELLAWPGLGAFQKAVTRELVAAERDLAADLKRQVFGSGEVGEFTGLRTFLDAEPERAHPPERACTYCDEPTAWETSRCEEHMDEPCSHCGGEGCSYDDDC